MLRHPALGEAISTQVLDETAVPTPARDLQMGIGRQLLKEAERRARSGGAARIELTSGSQRTEAHAFYRACGYKDSSVRFVKQLGA